MCVQQYRRVKQKGIVLKPGVYNVLIQEISLLSLQSRSSQRSRSENISLQWVCVIIEILCVNMGSIKVVWFLLI